MTMTLKCYIEEYTNDEGQLSARLRQKVTGKKVDLGFADVESRRHFLRFLSAAKQNEASLPEVFSREGKADCVLVSGDLDFDAPDEIRFKPNDHLAYRFA